MYHTYSILTVDFIIYEIGYEADLLKKNCM